MKLPVFDGVQEALERRNVQRKRGLDRAKTTAVKKRRIELKRRRGFQRSEWTKTHGRDAYGGNDEHESDHDKVVKGKRGKAKPNPRERACVVLVGLQLTSVGHTEIVISTLNVPLQKQVPSLLL